MLSCDFCHKREWTIILNLYGVDSITKAKVINRNVYICDNCLAELIGSMCHLIDKNSRHDNPKQYKKNNSIPSIPWARRQQMKRIDNDSRIDLHQLLKRSSYVLDILKYLKGWK